MVIDFVGYTVFCYHLSVPVKLINSMSGISEEEQEQFLNADETDRISLNEIGPTVNFANGCLNNKCSETIGKCKSVESLRGKPDHVCVHNNLSKSINLVNDKKYLSQLSFKMDNKGEKNSSHDPEDSSCKCNQDKMSCSLSGHQLQDETTLQTEEMSMPGVVSVKLQQLNGQILPEFSTENENVFRAMQQHRVFPFVYETSQSSDSVICRICHSAGDEKLIAPCKCAGSTRYVHEPCLVTWFKKSVKNECELCRSEVKIKKINHSLSRWRKPEDRPIPLIWFSVFFIGLFLNILSIHVNASEYCQSTACLIFYIVNGFGIILDSAFLYFWFLKCRHYCKKWFALNQDWFIDDLDKVNDATQVQYVRSDNDSV